MISIQVSIQHHQPPGQRQHGPAGLVLPVPSISIQLASTSSIPININEFSQNNHHSKINNMVVDPFSDSVLMRKLFQCQQGASTFDCNSGPMMAKGDLLLALAQQEKRPMPTQTFCQSSSHYQVNHLHHHFATSSTATRPTKKQRLDDAQHRRTSKTVRFVPQDILTTVIPTGHHEYNCQDLWYNPSDYHDFRQDMKMNLFMHSLLCHPQTRRNSDLSLTNKKCIHEPYQGDNGADFHHKHQHQQQQQQQQQSLCIRGLEKYCFYSSHQGLVKDLRQLRFRAVLDQQQIQRITGHKDPQTIRLVAEVLSKRACDQALERAAQDYQDAYCTYNETASTTY